MKKETYKEPEVKSFEIHLRSTIMEGSTLKDDSGTNVGGEPAPWG